ncbi:Hypothetical predicted protein [Paramuricea clavata]|uniref:Uncharacterized protein n=1 Tax=Paramuricea clavata TaxID=317549 RepID=A0A6S7HZK1_PARCT|nr:Hypothetical predicted protein [Paramuricea clavata]
MKINLTDKIPGQKNYNLIPKPLYLERTQMTDYFGSFPLSKVQTTLKNIRGHSVVFPLISEKFYHQGFIETPDRHKAALITHGVSMRGLLTFIFVANGRPFREQDTRFGINDDPAESQPFNLVERDEGRAILAPHIADHRGSTATPKQVSCCTDNADPSEKIDCVLKLNALYNLARAERISYGSPVDEPQIRGLNYWENRRTDLQLS